MRANDERLDLLLGSRRTSYRATELADGDKIDVLRAYLRRWKLEVGVFFDGVDASSTDAELLAIAPKHPVFRVTAAPDGDRSAVLQRAVLEVGLRRGPLRLVVVVDQRHGSLSPCLGMRCIDRVR